MDATLLQTFYIQRPCIHKRFDGQALHAFGDGFDWVFPVQNHAAYAFDEAGKTQRQKAKGTSAEGTVVSTDDSP